MSPHRLFLALLLLISLASVGSARAESPPAQKIATVNSETLLALMPKTRQVENDMAAFAGPIEKQVQARRVEIAKFYQATSEQENKGKLTGEQKRVAEAKLRALQDALIQFLEASQTKTINKRAELMKPVVAELNAAIAAFAKENKITFVVEQGSFTYFDEATSITAALKAKLKL